MCIMRSVQHTQHFTARITETQGNVDFVINVAGSQGFCSRCCNSKYCSTVRRDFFVVAPCMLIVLSPLYVQLMHTNYYKVVKELK